MKFILVIWLANPLNFAEYDAFDTKDKCMEKMKMVQRALIQANSLMVVECREISKF